MFKVFAIPGGFAVAFVRPDGKATIQTETHSRPAAEKLAAQRNAAKAAEQARQQLHEIANSRPVRWFEPDAYA